MRHATYFEAVDIAQLMREFPIGDAFTARFRGMAPQDLRAHFQRYLRLGRKVEAFEVEGCDAHGLVWAWTPECCSRVLNRLTEIKGTPSGFPEYRASPARAEEAIAEKQL